MKQATYFDGAKKISLTALDNIVPGQDGAIFDGKIFRLDSKGNCKVQDLQSREILGAFCVDKADLIAPHSNAVCFGPAYFQEGDEFPLLYSNVYNNYSSKEDKREGICCVYRIFREDGAYTSQLVQLIQVDFVNDSAYWYSSQHKDVRPYGNFVVDTADNSLYAYVMRDESRKTRVFRFELPAATAGTVDPVYGVKVVKLTTADIKQQFDSEYTDFMQGGCCHKGMIYSVEGFTDPSPRLPQLRIFDTVKQTQGLAELFGNHGLTIEPEFIEVWDGKTYYSDNKGNFYLMEFED